MVQTFYKYDNGFYKYDDSWVFQYDPETKRQSGVTGLPVHQSKRKGGGEQVQIFYSIAEVSFMLIGCFQNLVIMSARRSI